MNKQEIYQINDNTRNFVPMKSVYAEDGNKYLNQSGDDDRSSACEFLQCTSECIVNGIFGLANTVIKTQAAKDIAAHGGSTSSTTKKTTTTSSAPPPSSGSSNTGSTGKIVLIVGGGIIALSLITWGIYKVAKK